MPLILGIESTCDETAAAVVADGVGVRSSIVASQVALHARYRGVVPEIASRAHIENIIPVLRESLDAAGVAPADLDAVAVAHRPGLVGSLLIGVTAAKSLAWALGKPLIGVDHVQAHLYSVVLDGGAEMRSERHPTPALAYSEEPDHGAAKSACNNNCAELPPPRPSPGVPVEGEMRSNSSAPPRLPMPAAGLVCSGGHTALYRVNGFDDVALIGSTIDDAVGEAYDKVAAMLNLGYPGGPILDALAAEGSPTIKFPRTYLGRDSLDFSFSGLKTAVLYHVRGFQGRQRGPETLSHQELRDVAASFQAACIDVIVRKLRRAVRHVGAKCAIIGGGVSANRGLRAALAHFDVPVFFPPMRYCTDNAAMTAGLASLLYERGKFSALDLDV